MLSFPNPKANDTVCTGAIREARTRILMSHRRRGQMVILTGKAGAGKTMAAQYIAEEINSAYNAGAEHAFRAEYYVASDLSHVKGDLLQKRLLSEFGRQVLKLPTPKDLRTLDVPGHIGSIASGLRITEMQLVFIDEAGHIPAGGLEHLVTLLNTVTTAERHPLTLVLAGMHDLHANTRVLKQVARRTQECIFFEACEVEAAVSILELIHPYFATLDVTSEEGRAVMEFLRSPEVSDGGLIGLMVPLVERAVTFAERFNQPMGIRAMRLAHAMSTADHAKAAEAEHFRWGHPKPRKQKEHETKQRPAKTEKKTKNHEHTPPDTEKEA
jgi:hypothetical protein